MSKDILLVDEDALVLKALKRSLRELPSQWQVHYAENTKDAQVILSSTPIDILICEVRLAGDDGRMLLKTAREIRPQAARIVLTGYTDPNSIFEYSGLAHQLLAKPWNDRLLIETIQRSYLLRGLLSNEHMKAVLNKIDSLPTIPAVYLELVEMLKSEDSSLEEITESVSKDPSLTVKILQIVNSPYYGLPMKVVDTSKAVGLLGIDLLKGIVLASGLFKKYQKTKFKSLSIDSLWEHAVDTSSAIKQIAKIEALEPEIADSAAIAGLLHDVGKIFIAFYFPDEWRAVQRIVDSKGVPCWKAELKVLGTTHAEVGAYLLGLWGMPIALLKAVLCHHQPISRNDGNIDTQVLLHVANAVVNAQAADECDGVLDSLDQELLKKHDLSDRVSNWKDTICSMV